MVRNDAQRRVVEILIFPIHTGERAGRTHQGAKQIDLIVAMYALHDRRDAL